MATFTKLESGSWRVQVRRKRQYVANTFLRRHDAEEWALDVERSIDRGIAIKRARPHEPPRIFSDLITLHIDDMTEVGCSGWVWRTNQSVRRCVASSKSDVPRLIRWVPLPPRQQRYQAALPVRCPSQKIPSWKLRFLYRPTDPYLE